MASSSADVRPESVYRELRAGILAQQEPAGSAIAESVVALRFGVARATARLAIERLVAEGLLWRSSHRAARIPTLDRDDIVDLYDNRALIESVAIGALARGGTIPAPALAAHRELLRQARHNGTFAAQDTEFHRQLVTGQPSPRLALMHARLMGEIELCIAQVQAHGLLTARQVARQHQRILDAITAGRADSAARLTREHVVISRDALLAHYDTTHASVADREVST